MAQDSLEQLARSIAAEAASASSLTLGLISGSCHANDRRAIDKLALAISIASHCRIAHFRTLVLRLEMESARMAIVGNEADSKLPVAGRSPLGSWWDLTIPVNIGRKSTGALVQISQWLPVWKTEFALILIDLGPLDQSLSRDVGRLCDSNYLMLGPEACASQDWLVRHLALHRQAGSSVCGSVVTTLAAAWPRPSRAPSSFHVA